LLAVTAELLDEVGFEAFNTNLLAARSCIGTRAIYRYFPNKHALVAELATQMAMRWQTIVAEVTAKSQLRWPDIWPVYLDAWVTAVRDTTGGVSVLKAMRLHPELRSVDDTVNAGYIASVAAALRRASPSMTRTRARLVATLLLRTTVAGLDAILEETTPSGRRMFEMLKSMQVALLQVELSA
jgi:AcrR family transcriptional regulator